jgi:DNA topoisomerase-1
LAVVPIEEVKRMIELQVPDAFAKKAKAPAKKSTTKKTAPKKAAKKKV